MPPDSMSILEWNYKRLGCRKKLSYIKKLVRKYDPMCIVLMETKANKVKLQKLGHSLGFAFIVVYMVRQAGSLAFFSNYDTNYMATYDHTLVSKVS